MSGSTVVDTDTEDSSVVMVERPHRVSISVKIASSLAVDMPGTFRNFVNVATCHFPYAAAAARSDFAAFMDFLR